MTSRRIALIAAATAALAWTVKSVAIGLAGGLGKSPIEAPMFFVGLMSFVVAAVSLGVALTVGRPTWFRVAAGFGGFLVGFAFTMLVDAAVETFYAPGVERHWVWTEFNLWVAAAVGLALAVSVDRRGRAGAAHA